MSDPVATAIAAAEAPSTISRLVPFAQVLSPVIGWLILVGGWVFVSRDNDKRERRKEVRSLLDGIADIMLAVEDDACEYFRKAPADSAELALKIRRGMSRLGPRFVTLCAINSKFEFSNQLVEYRQAITGGDFDSASRQPRQGSDGIFERMSSRSQELLIAMEQKFNEVYPRK